jgi:hypothetical protein
MVYKNGFQSIRPVEYKLEFKPRDSISFNIKDGRESQLKSKDLMSN